MAVFARDPEVLIYTQYEQIRTDRTEVIAHVASANLRPQQILYRKMKSCLHTSRHPLLRLSSFVGVRFAVFEKCVRQVRDGDRVSRIVIKTYLNTMIVPLQQVL